MSFVIFQPPWVYQKVKVLANGLVLIQSHKFWSKYLFKIVFSVLIFYLNFHKNWTKLTLVRIKNYFKTFYTLVSRRSVLCDWVWRTGVHTGFRTIILVLYIGSLPNLATWFPYGREKPLFILGSLGQRSRSPLL